MQHEREGQNMITFDEKPDDAKLGVTLEEDQLTARMVSAAHICRSATL